MAYQLSVLENPITTAVWQLEQLLIILRKRLYLIFRKQSNVLRGTSIQAGHVAQPDEILAFNHQNSCRAPPRTWFYPFTASPVHDKIPYLEFDTVWSRPGMERFSEGSAMVSFHKR